MRKPLITLLAAVLLCSGCTALGLATPKSFDQSLAEAYGVHTAVVSAAATALSAGSISSKEAVVVKTQADTSRAMLDAARAVETSNPTQAKNDLTLATAALSALQAYLNSIGAK
jgi:hypothetical protein